MSTLAPTQPSSPRPPMSAAQLAARANQRAHERRIHVMAVAGRPGVYQVSSLAEPGTKQTLIATAGGEVCSCRGFAYRRSCCHVEALRNRLAREATKPVHQPARPLCACDLYDLRAGEVCRRCGAIG